MAGFVTIDSSGYLDQLVVAPDHWGSPLATMLVDEAKRRSPDGVTLKVNADNARAIRFYERNGFAHAGEDVNPGSKRPVLKMAWKPLATAPLRHLSEPRMRGSSTPRLLISYWRLWNTGSPAFAGDDSCGVEE